MSKNLKVQQIITIILFALFLSSCKKSKWEITPTYYKSKYSETADKKEKPARPSVMNRNPQNLTFDELKVAKNYAQQTGNKRQIIIYLENMVKQCIDPNLLKDINLELADLHFELGNMEQASKLYTAYINLFPGSPQRAYVHYQAILCKFYSTFTPDRDQTRTEETFKLTQLYLDVVGKQDELYKEYADEVSSIQKQCCKKLYDHEKDIFNFYFKKRNYKAAQVHLDEMKKTFIALMKSDVEPELIALECSLATKQGNNQLFELKQHELITKYPHQATITLAANLPKTDHVTRF